MASTRMSTTVARHPPTLPSRSTQKKSRMNTATSRHTTRLQSMVTTHIRAASYVSTAPAERYCSAAPSIGMLSTTAASTTGQSTTTEYIGTSTPTTATQHSIRHPGTTPRGDGATDADGDYHSVGTLRGIGATTTITIGTTLTTISEATTTMVTTLPQAAGTVRSTEVTVTQYTLTATAEAAAAATFPVHRARREPTQAYVPDRLHATTKMQRRRADAPYARPTATCSEYTTVPAAHATMLHATASQTSAQTALATTMPHA